jgi:hypothetical protein
MAEKRWEIVHWLRKVNEGKSNAAVAPSCKTAQDNPLVDGAPAQALPTPPQPAETKPQFSIFSVGGCISVFFVLGICTSIFLGIKGAVDPEWREQQIQEQSERQRIKQQQQVERQIKKTKEAYDRIQYGMSYGEVIAVAGGPTETITVPGLGGKICFWHVKNAPDGFHIGFSDKEKVIDKKQYGLK